MDTQTMAELLDTGAWGGRVRLTKGGHRRVHGSVIKEIEEMTAERYRMLRGYSSGSRLPNRIKPWDETVEARLQRGRERSRAYRARLKAEVAEHAAEMARRQAGAA